MQAKNTHSILNKPSKTTTKSHLHGTDNNTLASPQIGIISAGRSTYPCLDTSKRRSNNYNTRDSQNNINHTPAPSPDMLQRSNMPLHNQLHRCQTNTARNSSNKCVANSCFGDEWLTAHCCVPLVQPHCKRQNQPKTQWNNVTITQLHCNSVGRSSPHIQCK